MTDRNFHDKIVLCRVCCKTLSVGKWMITKETGKTYQFEILIKVHRGENCSTDWRGRLHLICREGRRGFYRILKGGNISNIRDQ